MQLALIIAAAALYLYLDGKAFFVDSISLLSALVMFLWIAVIAVTIVPVALVGTVAIGPFARLAFNMDTTKWGRTVVNFITRWMFFGAKG